jgi:protease I
MLGAQVQPTLLLANVQAADYDAVVFIGGTGAQQYFHDPVAHALAQETAKQGKLVAAICIAPATLANAGLLKGKKATCWKSEAETLKKGGATYTGQPVEADGKIITGSGPQAAKEFGLALAKALGG